MLALRRGFSALGQRGGESRLSVGKSLQHLPEPQCKVQTLSMNVQQPYRGPRCRSAPEADCWQADLLSVYTASQRYQTSVARYATEEA